MRWRAFSAIEIFGRLQNTTYNKFDLLRKTGLIYLLNNSACVFHWQLRDKYAQKISLHIQNRSNYLLRKQKWPAKSLEGQKIRRTTKLTLSNTDLKLLAKKQHMRFSLTTKEYARNTLKIYFYKFKICQIILKRNGLTFKEFPVKIYRVDNQIENRVTTIKCSRSACACTRWSTVLGTDSQGTLI